MKRWYRRAENKIGANHLRIGEKDGESGLCSAARKTTTPVDKEGGADARTYILQFKNHLTKKSKEKHGGRR